MNTLVAAGGTGQEIAAGVLRLSYLAGLDLADIVVFDSDTAVDDTKRVETRTHVLHSLHEDLRDLGVIGSSRLRFLNPTALETNKKVVRIGDFFSNHEAFDPHDRTLLDLLLDPAQQELAIDDGFHGQPAVGALAFAAALHQGGFDAWLKEIRSATESQQGLRVLFAGSLMGGVGASVIPVLVERISQLRIDGSGDVKALGLFQLPWFKLQHLEHDTKSKKADVDSPAFDRNTTGLLKGYLDKLLAKRLDCMFLIGLPRPVARVSYGGSRQPETKHFVCLSAAMAAANLLRAQATEDMLGSGEAWRGIHAPSVANDAPGDALRGGTGGPSIYRDGGSALSVDGLVRTARCLMAVSNAFEVELQAEIPVQAHQSVVRRALKGLRTAQASHDFHEALKRYSLLHHGVLTWLQDSIVSEPAETVRAFHPQVDETVYFNTSPGAILPVLGGSPWLAFERRVIDSLGPMQLPEPDKGGAHTAAVLMRQVRGQILDRLAPGRG